MRRSLTALTAVLNQETHRCVEGEITMPSSSGGQDTKRSKKTSHGRGKDEEEGNEETKSGRKNLRRQSECGRKKKDQCFRHGGKEREETASDERKFESDAVCACWLFGVK